MSRTGLPHDVVVYPCSDGQPMAETELHGACMVYVAQALRRLFETRGRADVYVGSNNFLYYERGNPRAVVSPDVYVVVGARAGLRDTYLLWNEPKGPDFVLEVTSASTRRDDERRKRDVYAALGVSEYFLYDPRAEYLAPALQGFRLREGVYRALPAVTVLPGRGVAVASAVLGLELRDEREAPMLRLRDPETGRDLLTYQEEAAARRTAETRLEQEAAVHRETQVRLEQKPRPVGKRRCGSSRKPRPAGRRRRAPQSWKLGCGAWRTVRLRTAPDSRWPECPTCSREGDGPDPGPGRNQASENTPGARVGGCPMFAGANSCETRADFGCLRPRSDGTLCHPLPFTGGTDGEPPKHLRRCPRPAWGRGRRRATVGPGRGAGHRAPARPWRT